MSLTDKARCMYCGHPRYMHALAHHNVWKKCKHSMMQQRQIRKCLCIAYISPWEDNDEAEAS